MTKIPAHVMEFAQGNVDIYKAFAEYFRHNAAVNFGKKEFSYNKEVSLEEKEKQVNEMFCSEVKRISGVPFEFGVATMATNPQVQWAGFAIMSAMIDTILPETIVDSIGMYTDVVTGGFGDSFAFDIEPRNLFVVSKGGRSKKHYEVKKQYKGQVTVLPEQRDITVQVSFYKVLAGKESLASFAMKAVRSLETQMTVDVYNAFNTAMTNLPTTPVDGELKITGWTQDAGVKLAQRVTAYNQGAKAVFVGTQVALSKILPANSNFRFMLDSDYVKMGYIQTAFGYDCVVLPQVADYQNPHKVLLDDTRIYVLSPSSQKLVKLCIEGETITNTDGVYDNANLAQNTTIRKAYGTAIATNSIAGVITLS